MSKKCTAWLLGQLPELVAEGVIPAESAAQLRRRYGEPDGGSSRNTALIVCSILGALLIGAGIILLVAYNWEELSRGARIVLAIVPLIVAQILAGWTIQHRQDSLAWREGVATFLMLSFGASLALVNQTYQISGDVDEFLLTWMLLGLPVVYLMNATLPGIMYLMGITAWAGTVQATVGFWLLAVLLVPYFVMLRRANPYGSRVVVLGWVLCFCCAIGIGITGGSVMFRTGAWMLVYSSYFAIVYLVGTLWFEEAPATWQKPFQGFGWLGIAGLSFLLTIQGIWELSYRFSDGNVSAAVWVLLGGMLLTVALSLYACARRGQASALLFGSVPLVALAAWLLGISDYGVVASVLFNLYFLMLGIGTIVIGVRSGRMGTVNLGMLLVAVLAIARFFDADVGFVLRGIGFIIVGIGFLGVNLWLRRGKGGA